MENKLTLVWKQAGVFYLEVDIKSESRKGQRKEEKMLKKIGTGFVFTSPVTGREEGFATARELFRAAAESNFRGECLRADIPEVMKIDLRHERRRIEDNLRKSDLAVYRAMADDGIYYI
jgi:hypothetical protein